MQEKCRKFEKINFLKFFFQKFCRLKNNAYLCIANEKTRLPNAKIAQLVEHNLAKVGVAGSSPVFRSNSVSLNFRPGGGIGRHATLRG